MARGRTFDCRQRKHRDAPRQDATPRWRTDDADRRRGVYEGSPLVCSRPPAEQRAPFVRTLVVTTLYDAGRYKSSLGSIEASGRRVP